MRSVCSFRSLILCAALVLLAGAIVTRAAEDKIDAAIKLMRDDTAMRKPETRAKVAAAFAGLKGAEATAAAEKLLTLQSPARGAVAVSLRNLGNAAAPVILSKLNDDATWTLISKMLGVLPKEAIPQVIEKVNSKDTVIHNRAAHILISLARNNRRSAEAKALVPKLIELLDDGNLRITMNAAVELGYRRDPGGEAVPPVRKLLRSRNPQVQVTACQTLERLGPIANPAVADLLALVRNPRATGTVRAVAFKAHLAVAGHSRKIQAIEKDIATIVAHVAATFGEGKDDVAVNMAKRIATLGEPAVIGLTPFLKSKSVRHRRFAAFSIAKIGGAAVAAASQLTPLLKDESARVRRNAAEALGEIGAVQSVEVLTAALSDKDVGVTLAAVASLKKLAGDDEAVVAAIAESEARQAQGNVSVAEKSPGTEDEPKDYLIGGPLAGVRLKRFATQHGEPAGYPGAIPELASKALTTRADAMAEDESLKAYGRLNSPYTTVGNYPEYELYDGSVEHWRAYMLKYMDIRSLYDRQSQVKNWVASNEGGTKFWRADYLAGDRNAGRIAFKLDGPVTKADFASGKFRLWEYGVGDTVRHSTFASLKRLESGEWLLEADVDVTIGLKCEGMESSIDGEKWRRIRTRKVDGLAQAKIRARDVSSEGKLLLRVR